MAKRISPKPKIVSTKSTKGDDMAYLNYVLIFILGLLLIYTLIYTYNIHKSSKEAFENSKSYHIIYVYSDSCGFCKRFTPEFNKFKSIAESKTSNMSKIASISQYRYDDPTVSMYNSILKAFPAVLIVDEKGAIKEQMFGYKTVDTLVDSVKASLKE